MALPGEPKDSKNGSGGDINPDSSNINSPSATTTLPISSNPTITHDNEDTDFDPTAQALVDEIDDERTLEEEEALAGNSEVAVQNELDDLKKESEMPIEELLAYYQRMRDEEAGNGEQEEEEDEDEELEDEDDDEEFDEDEDEDDAKEVRKQSRKRSLNRVTTEQSNHSNNHLYDQSNQLQQSQQQQTKHEQSSTQSQPDEKYLSNPPSNSPNRQHNSDMSRSDATVQSNMHFSGTRENPPKKDQNDQSEQAKSQDATDRMALPLSESCPQPDDDSHMLTVSSTSRPRHSMTEFLLGSENNADSVFRTFLDHDLDDSDDYDENYSYTDDDNDDERDWRRSIHVGPEHQADVPEGLSFYEGDLLPYESEDKLLWKCSANITQEEILNYLKLAALIPKRNNISISPSSVPKISDDNLRLYRERIHEQNSSQSSELHSVELNDGSIVVDNSTENLHNVYMSQSRKRVKIDYELEQENAMDGLNQTCEDSQVVQGPPIYNTEDNSTMTSSQGARPELSAEEYFQDEEQLLYLLVQCNHNFEEALRRRRLDPFKYYIHEPMSLWSQDECLSFEHGLRLYGKDFRLIRENNVPTRTRAEVVAFYYLWKKSERHDVYTNQYKLDRKRCLTHPGTTDYMDRFIEDNESILNASTTPTESTTENQTPDALQNHQSNTYLSGVKQAQQLPHQPTSIQCRHVSDSVAVEKSHYNAPKDDENHQVASICVDTDGSI